MPRISTTSTGIFGSRKSGAPWHNTWYSPSIGPSEKFPPPSTSFGSTTVRSAHTKWGTSRRALFAARAKELLRRRSVKWGLIVGCFIALILIIVPTSVILSRQKAAAAAAANNISIADDPNARVRPYTSLARMNMLGTDTLFFQNPNNAISYGNLSAETPAELPVSSIRNGTSLAASIRNSSTDPGNTAMVVYFIHASKKVSSMYVLSSESQNNWTEAELFAQKGDSGDVFAADSFGPALGFIAAPGARYNSSLNILDGGSEVFLCGDDGKLHQYNDVSGGAFLAYTFPNSFCSWTAVSRRAPYSYLFTRASQSDNTIQLWHRKYTENVNDEPQWEQGPQSPMTVPQTNYFCADGELFAFQAEDGTIQTAQLAWNDNDPSKTSWGAISTVSPKGVPGGSSLTCEWKSNTDMQIFYQAQSAAVGWFESQDGGKSWDSDRAFGSTCKAHEGQGVCENTSRCKGISYTENLCPNDPDDIECCVEIQCTANNQTGFCRSKTHNGCAGGTFIAGNGPPFPCPGDDDIQCCVLNNSTSPSSPLAT